MKKKSILLILLCLVCLTGCGEKKLTCTRTKDNEDFEISEKYLLEFDKEGKKIKKGNVSLEINVKNKKMQEKMDELENEMLEDEYSEIINLGADVKTEIKNNIINLNIAYDTADYTNEELDELYYVGVYSEGTYEMIKEDFEDDEFICE